MSQPAPPFHKPVSVAQLNPAGEEFRYAANPGECAGIAELLKIPGVDSMACEFLAVPQPGGLIVVRGILKAKIQQVCVVSLGAFPVAVSETFEARFSRRTMHRDDGGDVELPEPVIDGVIDLGAVAVEYLGLALDPYPRKPGAEFKFEGSGPARESPFAALAALKKR